MISSTNRDIMALRKRMNKALTDVIYAGSKIKYAEANGQPWLADGVAVVVYDQNSLIFSNEKVEDYQGIAMIVEAGRALSFLPNAHLEYLKPTGNCLAAQLKDDSNRRLMINNTYYRLFGDKFDFKLYVPGNMDELQEPAVYVFYLDELVGLILPIKQQKD